MQQTIELTQQNQQVHRTVLDNGITVLLVENSAADIISGRIFLKNAGARGESRKKAGLAHLLSTVLTKGTQQLSAEEIADRVESVGAGLGADAAADYFLLTLKTVSADFSEVLQLLAEIMRSPTFPEAEVELERNFTLQDIRQAQEQPFSVAFDQLRQGMYPHHPYGVSLIGTEETVAGLTRAEMQQYHQTYFRPDNLVISLSGRLSPEEATTVVERVFGDWQFPNAPLPSPQLPALTPHPCQKSTPQDTQQSIVMLGYLASSVHNADYPALKLLNNYLGNGLSSRLFVELREKRGLAYEVSAVYPTRLDPSQFVVYMGTAPENTDTAVAGLAQELERLCTTPLTPEELKAAQNKLLGQYALGKQSNAQIAQIFGWYETLGLGIEFDTHFQQNVANVTPEMAQQVARRYFQIEPYLSLVGPAGAVEGQGEQRSRGTEEQRSRGK
ncbi:MAG: peptidase M16 [Cyanobacteria bacterium SW_12_48_29]|jgi:predicted Zn-dependent peptidase|nr:MAG: peptidase M16 [Cyanobacteria bacterium QS_5_48_63]PSO89318.1 MAG: peptidase M16 [Cyanobacteria bacterium QS_6_48_18]PSP02915.1 MAG: peptidase M16 [Cyanobacteria bacterium SW_12_48_29]PSP09415.1 MAG: peptidase M16 [Cyanobacteria bacterium SW_10_48_33]PSP17804.1 MAG: peptidase M16 [Cyanobacteria bacterium SW_5_48_44]